MFARRLVVVLILVIVGTVGYLAWERWGSGALNGAPVAGDPIPGEPGDPLPTEIPPGATEATIEYVHDGDTLFLVDRRKVRLLNIDTPEVGDNLECYGDEATALLRRLLPEGTHVWVLSDEREYDRYGRSLLFVYTDDAVLVNLELVEQGAAEVLVLEPNVLFEQDFHDAEDEARTAGLGLWAACG